MNSSMDVTPPFCPEEEELTKFGPEKSKPGVEPGVRATLDRRSDNTAHVCKARAK